MEKLRDAAGIGVCALQFTILLTLLGDSDWTAWSDREIARKVGVSNDFVSRLRTI